MKEQKKKILITGVSGMLGNNFAWYFQEHYTVTGIYHRNRVTIDNVETFSCDLSEDGNATVIIQDLQPDIIIHCAGLVDVDRCEQDKAAADIANINATRYLVQAVAEKDVKLVFISSDAVYDGVHGNYSENGAVAPQNYYGFTKYQGELETLKARNALVLRTNIFGWNITAKKGLAEWIVNSLRTRQSINGFADAYFSTIYTIELAKILKKALEKDLTGTYNCGSKDSCSKYEFAIKLANKCGFNQNLVKNGSLDDHEFIAQRGRNLSMDSSKIQNALGLKLPEIFDSIEAFAEDFLRHT